MLRETILSFHLNKKGSYVHCSYAAQSSFYKICLLEEEAMFLVFETYAS